MQDCEVEGNTCQGNTGYGIDTDANADDNHIHGNTVKGNTAGRIRLLAGTSGNKVHGNKVDGTISDSGTNTVFDNPGAADGKQKIAHVFTATDFYDSGAGATLALRGTNPDQYLGWLMSPTADWRLVGPVFTIPEDISPQDRTLDFKVTCALATGGAAGEDVVTNVGFAILSDGDQADEATSVAGGITTSVATKLADEVFTVAHAPGTSFTAGQRVRMVLRRAGADAGDDYPGNLYILGCTIYYWAEP